MNILVTGANGQLGNEMRIVSRETDDRYIFSDIVPAERVRRPSYSTSLTRSRWPRR